MIKPIRLIIGLFVMIIVASSCNFSQEDIANRAKQVLEEQVSKIDSSLVKKIDHQVKDVDTLIKQTTVKSIQNQIDRKLKDVDTLLNGIKNSIDTKQPVKE